MKKITERDVIRFFSKYRALDGYVGIFGFVIFYRIFATYFDTLILFSLTVRNLFEIDLEYHGKCSRYPVIRFVFKVGKTTLIDNGKDAIKYYDDWHKEYLKSRKRTEEEHSSKASTIKEAVNGATFGESECGIAIETIRNNIDVLEHIK